MSIYPGAQFLISAAAPAQFPVDGGAEVAFAGRSNSGKSSAINTLTGRRALARTSKTPGRTRLLNFFELSAGKRIVDLPGYGFAEGPPAERDTWARLIEALAARVSLQGLFLVVDSRRGLLEGDRQLLHWIATRNRPVHVLLSKSDQLKRGEVRTLMERSKTALQDSATLQLFSARDGTGVEAARKTLDQWLAGQSVRPRQ
jgi:GTP-binding protein